MQNTQEISWWFEITKIAIPSLIALIVPLITYLWLTRKMAEYQTILSKELENYKLQLQSEFQTKFYTFQTKFSLWHQRQEKVAVETFEKLAEIESLFQKLANWENLHWQSSPGESEVLLEATIDKCQKQLNLFGIYYDKKRIYLDKVIREEALKIFVSGLGFLKSDMSSDSPTQLPKRILDDEIFPSMKKIEKRFELLFSAENTNAQLESN